MEVLLNRATGDAARSDSSDVRRFTDIWERHYGDVHAYIRRRVEDDADDVCAEVFLVAWRRRRELPRDPLPWLYGVARNCVGTAWRANARRSALTERVRRLEEGPGDDQTEPASMVLEALDAVSAEDRELLLLVYWEDLKPARAGQALGLSAPRARTRLWRARRRLQLELDRRREA